MEDHKGLNEGREHETRPGIDWRWHEEQNEESFRMGIDDQELDPWGDVDNEFTNFETKTGEDDETSFESIRIKRTRRIQVTRKKQEKQVGMEGRKMKRMENKSVGLVHRHLHKRENTTGEEGRQTRDKKRRDKMI